MLKVSEFLNYFIINFHHPPQRFDHQQSSGRNNCSMRRQKNNSRIRHHFLTDRVSTDWNCLSQEIIDTDNINIFKNVIDKLLKLKFFFSQRLLQSKLVVNPC
jgi:hypothetical protein